MVITVYLNRAWLHERILAKDAADPELSYDQAAALQRAQDLAGKVARRIATKYARFASHATCAHGSTGAGNAYLAARVDPAEPHIVRVLCTADPLKRDLARVEVLEQLQLVLEAGEWLQPNCANCLQPYCICYQTDV